MSRFWRRLKQVVAIAAVLSVVAFAWWVRPKQAKYERTEENGRVRIHEETRAHRVLPLGQWSFGSEVKVYCGPIGSCTERTCRFGVFEMVDADGTEWRPAVDPRAAVE